MAAARSPMRLAVDRQCVRRVHANDAYRNDDDTLRDRHGRGSALLKRTPQYARVE